MFKNWQTTAGAISGLFGVGATIFHDISVGQMPDASQLGVMWAAISFGIGLLRAKDQNVTGGTIPQTAEAEHRVAQ